jgi:hypothetical protein
MFRRYILLVYSGLKIKQNRQTTTIAVCFLSLLLTLKMEAVCSSETSAGFYQTTWHHIPAESIPDVERLQKMGKQYGQF